MVKKRGSEKNSVKGSNSFFVVLIISLILFVFQSIFVFSPILNDYSLHNLIGNMFIVSISSLALISSILIYQKISVHFPREKKGKFFLAVSLFLFFLGDLLWLLDEVFLNKFVPVGSVPDFIWISAYIFLIITLFYFISISFRPSRSTTYWIILLAIIVSGVVLFLDISEDLEENSFEFVHAIQDSYILFDSIAFFLVVYLIWPIFPAGKRFYLNWLMLGIGIFIRAVYDKLFADMSQHANYYTGHPIDLMYTSFYLFIIASFYFKAKSLESFK